MSATTAVKERPILFSGPMVRAILEGRKTQTRRAIATDWWRCLDPEDDDDRASAIPQCPYGQPGERLWVREAWDCWACLYDRRERTHRALIAYRANGERWIDLDAETAELLQENIRHDSDRKWRPSIHMPRWASRLTLEITRVRVERVQDISEYDAQTEGVTAGDAVWSGSARSAFRELWDSINANRGLAWATNPWVWAIDFRRIEP